MNGLPGASANGCYTDYLYHNGFDINAGYGTDVKLVGPGIIQQISDGTSWTCGGTTNSAVLVKHRTTEGWDFIAIYGHLERATIPSGIRDEANKASNQRTVLGAGTLIGKVGTYCTLDHLHFGVYVPQWNDGYPSLGLAAHSALPPLYTPSGVPTRSKIGYGTIGMDYWQNTFGWAHPINFIEQFHPSIPGGAVSPDDRAKAEMEQYMSQHTPYGGNPIESSLLTYTNYWPNYDMRQMQFGYLFSGNQNYLWVYHVTYTPNPKQRWVGYTDPYGRFQGWYYVGE
jgi:hypothetical protein